MTLGARGRVLLVFVVVGALVGAGLVYYLWVSPSVDDGKLSVVASFYPYAFMAARVGGDQARIANLIPPGVEPHEWIPTPSAIVDVYGSDVFVYNGYIETFLGSLLAGMPTDGPVLVNTSADLTLRTTENGEVDPHVWLDPVLAREIVDSIETAFSSMRPAAASLFRANADRLRSDLAAIDGAYTSGLGACERRTIVTQHEAFGYVTARYNLTGIAIQGLSPDTEPTPAQLAAIRDVINATGTRYIFYETLVDPQVAQTLAEEAGVGTLVLDPAEGLTVEGAQQGNTYLTILADDNLANLRLALACT